MVTRQTGFQLRYSAIAQFEAKATRIEKRTIELTPFALQKPGNKTVRRVSRANVPGIHPLGLLMFSLRNQ
jgi:hypothetical protein